MGDEGSSDMCGIAGYLSSNVIGDDVLVQMTRALAHRGPDAEGYYRDGPVAFGHRRLAVLDIEGSSQPMSTADGALTCVTNGEIYNFARLREMLSARGHVFRTSGDTEVLLHAYREYGTRMFDYLQGMFAFALWDRVAQRLLIARDHIGVKPLYYSWDGATLVFGSELKAVVAHPMVSPELDLEALGLYLECQYIPSPKSIYRHVQKLKPGHALIVEKGKLVAWQYWHLDYSGKFAFGEADMLEHLEEELRRSVESMLVSDVPLGAFLSGGVDSSLISALMTDISGRPIDTFTVGFEGTKAESEHEHAEFVSRHINSKHHVLMVSGSEVYSNLDKLIEAFDEPLGDPAAMPTMFLAKLARQLVTVALTGEGADELFGGYSNYRKRVSEERISTILGARYSPLRYLMQFLPARLRKDRLLKAIGQPHSRRYTTIPQVFDVALRPELFSKEFLVAQRTSLAEYAERFFEECNSPHYIDKLMYIDARLWLPDDLLTKVDRATMAYSLEARVPYLDQRFVEFCAGLNPHLKQRGRTGKYLLKRLGEKLLPPQIVHRRKQGFTPPLREWLMGPFRDEVQGATSPHGLGKRGLFNAGALQKLWHEHRSAQRDHSGRLWALLILEKWFQRYAPHFGLERPARNEAVRVHPFTLQS